MTEYVKVFDILIYRSSINYIHLIARWKNFFLIVGNCLFLLLEELRSQKAMSIGAIITPAFLIIDAETWAKPIDN